MTQEDKDLLLKDLCARSPYKVEVYYSETVPISTLKSINPEKGTCIVYDHSQWYRHSKFHIEEIKPYLRPISSMTKEEVNELFRILKINEENAKEWIKVNDIGIIRLFTEEGKDLYEIAEAIDYLHSIHIDYRGLIELGLALESSEGMYNIKNNNYGSIYR